MKIFLKKYALGIYWAFLLLDSAFIYLKIDELRWLTKLSLMPILAYYLVLNTTKRHLRSRDNLFYVGLFLAWVGDFFLLFESQDFFLAGMAAFFAMQLTYAAYFYLLKPPSKDNFHFTFLAMVIVGIATYFVYRYLQPHLGDLQIPVVIYMVAICLSASLSSNVLSSTHRRSLGINYFVPGMLVFLFSDTMLALNKFVFKEAFLDIVVMLSYGYAQQLLAQGNRKLLKS